MVYHQLAGCRGWFSDVQIRLEGDKSCEPPPRWWAKGNVGPFCLAGQKDSLCQTWLEDLPFFVMGFHNLTSPGWIIESQGSHHCLGKPFWADFWFEFFFFCKWPRTMIGENFDGNTRNKTEDTINVHSLPLQFFHHFPILFLGSFGSTGHVFFWIFQPSPVMVGLWLGLPH